MVYGIIIIYPVDYTAHTKMMETGTCRLLAVVIVLHLSGTGKYMCTYFTAHTLLPFSVATEH